MDPRVRPADDGKRKMILPRRNQLQTLRTGAIPIAVLSDFKGLRRLFHRTRSSSHGPSSLTMSQCIVVIKSLKVRACGSVLPARPAAAAIDKRKSRVRPFGKKMSSFQKSIAERGISNHKGRPKRTCRRWPISRSSRSAARRRARHGFERQPDSVRTGDDCLQRSLPCICYHPLFVFNQGSAIWNAPLSVPASPGWVSTTFQSCQSVGLDAFSLSLRPSSGECRFENLPALQANRGGQVS
jgi:hypothetical protein